MNIPQSDLYNQMERSPNRQHLRGWMSLPKRWEMALTAIPYKTKQLTFKMEAVNAAPFPNAISL